MALVRDPITGEWVDDGRPNTPPPGIGLSTAQQTQQQQALQRQAMAQRIDQTRQNVGQFVGQVGATAERAAMMIPRTLANTTFDDRLPGQANREATRARQQTAQNAAWVDNNPEQAQAAQEFGVGAAQSAVNRAMQAPVSLINPPASVAGEPAPLDNPIGVVAPEAVLGQNTQPLDIAGLNRGLAEQVTEAPIYQPQERGNFNMYNTDQNALAARAAPTNGINFGFGVGGAPTASEYLATMQARDDQTARETQQRRDDAQAGIDRIGLRNRMERGSPSEQWAARAEYSALERQRGAATARRGNADIQQMQSAAQRDVADIQGQFGLQQAEITAAGNVAQADILAQQRTQDMTATLAQQQAQFESDPANVRTAIISQLAGAALQAGDIQGAVSVLYGTQPAGVPKPDIKLVSNAMGETVGVVINGQPQPWTPEQAAEFAAAASTYR